MGDMTKIEALKAKWQDAREAEQKARAEYEAECVAEKLREFEAMGGVIGVTKVRACKYPSNGPDLSRGPFVVTGAAIEWGKARFTVSKIKKDGTASNAAATSASSVVILPEDNQ